jgi:hypothetical protein
MPNPRKEAENHNLRNLAVLGHQQAKIIGGTTRVISSRRQESINLATSGTRETMRMKKQKWEHHVLPEGFAEQKYPKDSSYLMISESTMDHRNPSLG